MSKILIVDDSSTIRKLVKFTLQMKKHEVTLAEDGLQAYRLFMQYDFDLIITDLNMPIMNGIELIKKIRLGSKFKDIPIILLTTESEEKDKKMGEKVGVTKYITKPFQPPKLLKEIEEILKS
ncbi:response regulator [Haliovirga abyssi]|uniref:Response regulator n=1 Tax=Haliovirga abyssi TaxID=2996794 RepID=A0AAU9E1N4_9FUSO|nr:response regulator [Haliovirga abyssi]BDU50295.1 response regulator [Haliovirga abyssi]